VDARRHPERRHRLEQVGALLDEAGDPVVERERGIDGGDQRDHALGDALGDGDVQRREVVEVLEHRAHRDAGALGDPGGGRPKVALLDQSDAGVDDGLARA
jgi:hypothetical protein